MSLSWSALSLQVIDSNYNFNSCLLFRASLRPKYDFTISDRHRVYIDSLGRINFILLVVDLDPLWESIRCLATSSSILVLKNFTATVRGTSQSPSLAISWFCPANVTLHPSLNEFIEEFRQLFLVKRVVWGAIRTRNAWLFSLLYDNLIWLQVIVTASRIAPSSHLMSNSRCQRTALLLRTTRPLCTLHLKHILVQFCLFFELM